jgi:hypothetical protein
MHHPPQLENFFATKSSIVSWSNRDDVTQGCRDKHAEGCHFYVIGVRCMNTLDRVLTSFRGGFDQQRSAPGPIVWFLRDLLFFLSRCIKNCYVNAIIGYILHALYIGYNIQSYNGIFNVCQGTMLCNTIVYTAPKDPHTIGSTRLSRTEGLGSIWSTYQLCIAHEDECVSIFFLSDRSEMRVMRRGRGRAELLFSSLSHIELYNLVYLAGLH